MRYQPRPLDPTIHTAEVFRRDLRDTIIMRLWLAFGEHSRLALVLANLPFALVGGVLAVSATGAVLSLGSLVGFVTLFGIATRNAVMLISDDDHLVWLRFGRFVERPSPDAEETHA